MKIIQVNTVYGTGSVGKIVASIHAMTEQQGHHSAVAYGRGKKPAENHINGFLIGNKADFYRHVMYNFVVGSGGFSSGKVTKRFLDWLEEEKPDLIHLHNIHGFYLHVGMLFAYIKEKKIPVVWTFHDCWPFTGQCAYFDYIDCDKWRTQCHHCPIYRSDYPYSIFRDNSRKNYEQKREAFRGVPQLMIVTPSQWLAGLVKESFLGDYPCRVIPNGIDRKIFCPDEKGNAPAKAANKILLGVANIWDKRKGLSYLLRLSQDFCETNGYQVVIIGLSGRQIGRIRKEHGTNVLALPRTASQGELASWYRKAAIYINPTLQDNFPTTNLEALSCGTPVITFRTGGSPESVTDDTGIVVPKGDYEALKEAIVRISEKLDQKSDVYSVECCRKQAEKYDAQQQFLQYIVLYEEMIGKG